MGKAFLESEIKQIYIQFTCLERSREIQLLRLLRLPKGSNQSGIAHLLAMVILLIGLAVGLYLVAHPTVFKPKAAVSTQTQFYISPSGSDSNPGTETQPFKTIKQAQVAVRQVNKQATQDIVVNLKTGVYTLDAPLTFTPDDSGFNGHKVIYQKASESEVPIISGGRQISGWVQDGNKWKVHLDQPLNTRQLYVNGKRAQRAGIDINGNPLELQVTSFGFQTNHQTNMENWQNISDVEFSSISYYINAHCGIDHIVKSGNRTDIYMKQPCWDITQSYGIKEFKMGPPTRIENAVELLDQPGEWYYNKTTQDLYYIPRQGEAINQALIVAPVLEKLIQGTGTYQNPIKYLSFNGIIFVYATWLEPNTNLGHSGGQQGIYIDSLPQHQKEAPGNIDLGVTQYVNFENNKLLHLGASGIELGHGSFATNIIANHIEDVSYNGITAGLIPYGFGSQSELGYQSSNILIKNNYITNIATEYLSGTGIVLGYVKYSEISHNEVFNLPYSGIALVTSPPISAESADSSHNSITNNLVYDHMRRVYDGGGIYVNGVRPETRIAFNVIKKQQHVWGTIYLDAYSRYFTITENVIADNQNGVLLSIAGGNNLITGNYWQTQPLNAPNPEVTGPFEANIPDPITMLPYNSSPPPGDTRDFSNWTLQSLTDINSVNYQINSLNDAPPHIIAAAGIEPVFQSIKVLPDLESIFTQPISSQTPTLTPQPSSTKTGDLNGDNKVDVLDLSILLTNYGKKKIDPDFNPKADLKKDDVINVFDLSILLKNFGK